MFFNCLHCRHCRLFPCLQLFHLQFQRKCRSAGQQLLSRVMTLDIAASEQGGINWKVNLRRNRAALWGNCVIFQWQLLFSNNSGNYKALWWAYYTMILICYYFQQCVHYNRPYMGHISRFRTRIIQQWLKPLFTYR